jgi:hypothetical protein
LKFKKEKIWFKLKILKLLNINTIEIDKKE